MTCPMSVSPRHIACVLVGVLLIGWAHLHAQVDTATITGIVRDEQNAVLPGATVVATNVDTNQHVETVSNEAGVYRTSPLPIGAYTVSVTLSGFKTEIRSGITLNVQSVARIDVTLQVGQISEELTISGGAPLLETETSSLGQVIEEQAVTDLPLNGRNYLQLAKLATGVLDSSRGDRAADGGSFVANGVRASLNNFVLDGVDNNSKIVDIQNSSNVVIQPSVDAIQEFNVQTHNFSAEFGYSAGAVVNARIKSGTNAFHGTIFEFLRNDDLDARDFFSPPEEEKPLLIRNQFGGTLGGPIIHDQTFFFGSWEGTRERRGQTFVRTVPTAAQRQGDFSGDPIFDPATVREDPAGNGFVRDPFLGNTIPSERIDPLARDIVDLIPLPNVPGDINNFVSSPVRTVTRDQFDFRVDHALSEKDQFFGRYSLGELDRENPGPFEAPLIGSENFQQSLKDQRGQGIAIGETHIFSSTTVNELRVGYNRIRDSLKPFVTDFTPAEFGFQGIPADPTITGLPDITLSGFGELGEATFLPNFKISETIDVKDNLSFTKGNHFIKTGFQFRWVRSFFEIGAQARGQFTFNGTFTEDPQSRGGTGNAFADFLLGVPSSANLSTTQAGDIRYRSWGAYIQDDWKVTPKLTVNLGLRYELFTQPVERNDRQGNFLLDQRQIIFPNNQIPEGVPEDLAGTIPNGLDDRGLLDLDTNNFAPRVGLAYQLMPQTVVRAGGGIFYADHPAIGASGRLVASPPFQVVAQFPTDQVFPVVNFNEGFPADALGVTEFDPATTAFLAFSPDFPQAYAAHWNLNIQREIPDWFLVDIGYVGSKGTQLPLGVDFNQALPGEGSVESRRPIQGFGSIGGQLPGGNSNFNALELRVERRFSDGFSVLSSYTWSHAIDIGGEQLVGDLELRDVRNIDAERGDARFDVRHRYSLAAMWDLPVGENRRWDLGSSLLNAIVGNWQISGILTLQTGKPFTPTLGASTANTGHARPDRSADGNLPGSERSIEAFFDKSAFPTPAQGEFGNAGRNVLRGPDFNNLDLTLFKRIPFSRLGDQGEIQFRLEAFNVTNTPHFDLPNSRVDLDQGGTITSLAAPMRELQVGLKILF
ncbi:MAG: hypothetical protein GEV06_03360 [Luteitalea sp.]|nr:hypothetical protein [Luteitalea sp.]